MDELTMIERLRPVAIASPMAEAEARACLRDAMRRAHSGSRRRRRSRTLAIAASVGVAALVFALVAPTLLGGEGEAAATLRGLSTVAIRQPYEPLGPDGFVYTETVAVQPWCTVELRPDGTAGAEECSSAGVTREAWIALDGSGRIAQDGPGAMDETFGPGELYLQDLSTLPTDAIALRARLAERIAGSGASGGYEMFVVVGDLLRETHASPELRAALFEVAANLDDAELIGGTTDQRGREGIGIGYLHDGNLEVLIFDQETSAVIGERTEAPDGEVISWSVVVRSGLVDSIEERP